ncbi:hypothetical protein [Crenalkalicoccus roseus]|uniref:hypothetical protein n=1 Tax=Crenalkalicoccus roseus TaxID=1485588 RepID=UPI0010816808|nr:hypothetical protein [Crenalkalicoccus roseus]
MILGISSAAVDVLSEARAIVRCLVEAERQRGLAHAFHAVSRNTGLSARRVRAYWHGEVAPGAVHAHELHQLRRAAAEHMRAELRRAEARIALLRARLGEQDVASPDGEAVVLAPQAAA